MSFCLKGKKEEEPEGTDKRDSEPYLFLTGGTCGDDDMEKTFNKRIDEMDLSHIDSSESPSEETSPPNQGSSPPLGRIAPGPPRIVHKSFTENFLRVKEEGKVSKSLTEINGDYLKVFENLNSNFCFFFFTKIFRFEFIC